MSDTESNRVESKGVAGALAWLLPVGLVVIVLGLAWFAVFVVMNDLAHAAFVQDSNYETTER